MLFLITEKIRLYYRDFKIVALGVRLLAASEKHPTTISQQFVS